MAITTSRKPITTADTRTGQVDFVLLISLEKTTNCNKYKYKEYYIDKKIPTSKHVSYKKYTFTFKIPRTTQHTAKARA